MAVAQLAGVDLRERCAVLGLPPPDDTNGQVRVRAFGTDLIVETLGLAVTDARSGKAARLGDQILVLHYLHCDMPLHPTGDLITYRDLAGGQFYWQPFLARTVEPLLRGIGNRLDLLRERLARFDWTPRPYGDLGAEVHLLGRLALTLVYHAGDEEFPPRADVLFDACIKRVFGAEDAAACASRICLGLL